MTIPSRKRMKDLLLWISDTASHHGHPISKGERDPDGNIPDAVFEDIKYLSDHGLCRPAYLEQHHNMDWHWAEPVRITTEGRDWLSADGGLTAEKKTLTIRFDGAQFKDLLLSKVDEADAPEKEKSSLKEAISKAPTTVLQAALTEVTKAGIPFLPHGFQWLEKLFLG